MKDLLNTLGGPIRLALSIIALVTVFTTIGVAYSEGKSERENNRDEIRYLKAEKEKDSVLIRKMYVRQTVIMQKMGITVPD